VSHYRISEMAARSVRGQHPRVNASPTDRRGEPVGRLAAAASLADGARQRCTQALGPAAAAGRWDGARGGLDGTQAQPLPTAGRRRG